jgi:hypothetical protein
MRRLSSDSTFLYRFLPYAGLLAVIGFTIILINAKIYPALIFTLYFIFVMIASRFFYKVRHLCEIYVNNEQRVFKINDFNSEYFIPFKELIKFKTHNGKRIVELFFSTKRIYFIPVSGEFFSSGDDISLVLKKIMHDQAMSSN